MLHLVLQWWWQSPAWRHWLWCLTCLSIFCSLLTLRGKCFLVLQILPVEKILSCWKEVYTPAGAGGKFILRGVKNYSCVTGFLLLCARKVAVDSTSTKPLLTTHQPIPAINHPKKRKPKVASAVPLLWLNSKHNCSWYFTLHWSLFLQYTMVGASRLSQTCPSCFHGWGGAAFTILESVFMGPAAAEA